MNGKTSLTSDLDTRLLQEAARAPRVSRGFSDPNHCWAGQRRAFWRFPPGLARQRLAAGRFPPGLCETRQDKTARQDSRVSVVIPEQ
jgi:hypothetical protein